MDNPAAEEAMDPLLAEILSAATADLHPDLAPYVVPTEFGDMLKHPLVYQLGIASPVMKGVANNQYELKAREVERARAEGDWNTFVALHERPYRITALTEVPPETDGYWEMVATWWMDTEYPSLVIEDWLVILDSPGARNMMSDEERATLDALPARVLVYRGVPEGGIEEGLSWTLDKDRALWFAQRFGKPGRVLERSVSKTEIVAYLNGRQEQEIVLRPQ